MGKAYTVLAGRNSHFVNRSAEIIVSNVQLKIVSHFRVQRGFGYLIP